MSLARLHDDRGFAMVAAVVLMALMLGLGLAALGLTDSGSKRTREQRERESALQLDEGVLYAQSLVLSTRWANAANPYPPSCVSSGAADNRCPSATELAGAGHSSFRNVDQKSGSSSWITKVRDNGGALRSAYDPALADAAQTTAGVGTCPLTPCTYDFNKDNEVWVQAQSIVRGKPRNVVARLRLEEVTEAVPRTAITSGALSITNQGGHGGTALVQATGSTVTVRCASSADLSCVNAKPGQVVPDAQAGAPPNLMTPDQIARFKARAIADGRYYAGCPTLNAAGKYNLSGQVVFIEGCANPPLLDNSNVAMSTCAPPAGMSTFCTNTTDKPGLIIWHCGRATFAGSFTHRGVFYAANNSDGTCPAGLGARGDGKCVGTAIDETRDVLTTTGGFGVWGVIAVDGLACMKLGSNGLQAVYDSNVFGWTSSYGTVGLVQNTWRELSPKAV